MKKLIMIIVMIIGIGMAQYPEQSDVNAGLCMDWETNLITTHTAATNDFFVLYPRSSTIKWNFQLEMTNAVITIYDNVGWVTSHTGVTNFMRETNTLRNMFVGLTNVYGMQMYHDLTNLTFTFSNTNIYKVINVVGTRKYSYTETGNRNMLFPTNVNFPSVQTADITNTDVITRTTEELQTYSLPNDILLRGGRIYFMRISNVSGGHYKLRMWFTKK